MTDARRASLAALASRAARPLATATAAALTLLASRPIAAAPNAPAPPAPAAPKARAPAAPAAPKAPAPAASGAASAAAPGARARPRVIVAGATDDPLAARIEMELVAMGFEAIRAPGVTRCGRSDVTALVRERAADAVTCSDGDAVGVWLAEPNALRLRDVVVVRASDDHARDVAAVRAAEVARASLELRDPAPAPRDAADPPAAREAAGASAADADGDARAVSAPAAEGPAANPDRSAQPVGPPPRRTASFLVGAGLSTLLGADASVGTFSGDLELGVVRAASLALRAEIPFDSQSVSSTRVSAGFVGLGLFAPLAPPSAFVVPRLGGGFALAWVHASTTSPVNGSFDTGAQARVVPRAVTDTGLSPAAYADAAIAMRIAGPVRIAAEGSLGATASRIVVRGGGQPLAYWGRPFGALGLRMELEVK